jgi:hypothetical protein
MDRTGEMTNCSGTSLATVYTDLSENASGGGKECDREDYETGAHGCS